MSLDVRSLGPCQTCGREKLATGKVEPRTGGGVGVQVVWYVDCGKCPTLRVEQLPPSDEDAENDVLPF